MHLIFDLDGTLIDSRSGILASVELAVHKIYPHLDISRLQITVGPKIRDILHIAINQASPLEIDQMEIAFRQTYDSQGWKNSIVYPGVEETLKELIQRKYILYILTNKPILPTSNVLNHFGLSKYFHDVICSDSDKPKFINKASMLRYLMHKHAITCNNTICIGDSEDDFLAAQACGVEFIGIAYGYGILPQEIIVSKSLRSFPDILSTI